MIAWWVWGLAAFWCWTLGLGIAIGYVLAKREAKVLELSGPPTVEFDKA